MIIVVLVIIIAYVYYHIMFGSANAKLVRRLKKGRTEEQKKVVDYFVRQSSLGRMLAHTISDDDYEKMVNEKANRLNLRQKAVEQTGLDEDEIKEIDPINLIGYRYNHAWSRKADSGKQLSSRYQVTWIFFSESQLHMYQYTFDMDQDWHSAQTEEFFYQDVTSVSTTTSEETSRIMENGVEREESVNTTQFRMVVPGDKMLFAMNSTNLDRANDSVKAMKQMLREKKNA